MPKITQVPIPNTSIFEPVTSVYENNLTYVEFLLGVLKKLNETIEQVNKNSEFIEDYDGRIEAVENDIVALREFLETSVREQNAEIEARFATIEANITVLFNQMRAEMKAYTDEVARQLDAKIDRVAVGQINVLDPTTGVLSPLQDVLNNLAGTNRDALTADEYDGLDLTASTYDGYNISAFDYDYNGKLILMPNP